MTDIQFHPRAREAIQNFPEDVRYRIGRALYLLQIGESLGMPTSRPMPSVAPGISELRVRGEDGIFRVFYLVKISESVLVCHAFQKKTQKTSMLEIELARKRLKELLYG